MDNVTQLADLIYEYPTETVTKSGCEGLAKYLVERGVTFKPVEKFGRWIIHIRGHGRNITNWAECSECRVCGSPQWKVCPVCETRMEPIPLNDTPPEGTKTINVGRFDPDDFLAEHEED